MERRRPLLALVAEQSLEPAVAERRVRAGALVARLLEPFREVAERDALLLFVARHGIRDSGELARERALVSDQLTPALVELGRGVRLELAQLVAFGVVGEDGQLRLCRPERNLLALERDSRRENRVLELVLALGELLVGDAGLALEAQAEDPLVLVPFCPFLGRAERVELLAVEEIGVARDDLGALGDLLLPDSDGADFLGALEEVLPQALLVLRRGANRGDAHPWQSNRQG